MLWLLLACTASDTPSDDPIDTTVDTGDSGVVEEAVFDEIPDWESFETGVATGLAWADLNQDGFAELVIAYGNDIQKGPLSVYENIGGILDTHTHWESDTRAFYGHIDVGDVNGDGWIDVVASRFLGNDGFSEPGGVDVYLNREGILEPTPSWQSSESFYSFSCALGDVDRDGDLDLAVAVGEPYYNEPNQSHVYLNNGSGGFGSIAWSTQNSRHSMDVTWADFDGDGWLDLAFANQGAPHDIYKNIEGSLASQAYWEAPGDPSDFEGNTLDWGDVDGDGGIDLVVSDNLQLGGAGVVSLYCSPTFEPCWQSMDEPQYQSAVSLEDFDADGDIDLVAGSWWGAVRVYENDNNALSNEPSWESNTKSVIEAFGWEDIDRSDTTEETITGEGLLQIPQRARVLHVDGGVSAGGWATGTGSLTVTYAKSPRRDLAVSNWDREIGNHIYSQK